LRTSTRAVGAGLYTGMMFAGATSHARFVPEADRSATWDRWWRRWGGRAARLAGVELRLATPRPAPANGARLVVSNHRSAIDVLLIVHLFGGRLLSRGDLAGWPVIGPLARRAGTLFVDRGDRSSGAAALRVLRSCLRNGDTVTIFPEGTTFPGDEVRPFQPGAFVATRGLDVEVVPVGVAYPPGVEWFEESFGSHFENIAHRKRVPVGVALGNPRPLLGKPAEIATALHDEVQDLVHLARRALR
jgi:1-acyl-sn-glycerol-3-phosphate acyltransferase